MNFGYGIPVRFAP